MFRDLPAASLPTHRLPATRLVHALGQSNGAAMVYRLGCEAADIFASIIPFEGSPPPADYNCTPSEPVHLLHIHGTDDHTVYYDGKHRDMGAVDSVTFFGGYNGCSTGANATFLNNATIANAKYRGDSSHTDSLDISKNVNGYDTEVFELAGCASDGTATLWKVVGETHDPSLNSNYATNVVKWIKNHPKGTSGNFYTATDTEYGDDDDGALPVWSTVAIGIGLFLACFTVCVLGGYLVYEKVPGVKEWLSERALYNSRANPKHPPITRTTADPVV
mmetsp:Transcript_72246/g.205405  ORF Transcript_72246/g.205405 Transcript_72246/m.205405 type:complete len:276 (+) Transcript_72246:1001-1828(+)